MASKNLLSNKRGLTLIEMLIALGILSMVIAAIYSVSAAANRSATKNEVAAEVMENLRISMDFLEQDIRMAGLDRYGLAGAGIEGMGVPAEMPTATYLCFTADRNMDDTINTFDSSDGINETDGDLDRITYFYNAANNTLRQCFSKDITDVSCDTVAQNVTNFQFSYRDADGNLIPLPIDTDDKLSSIRMVQVSMTIQKQASIHGLITRTLSKRIICRNLEF
jgi:prepilin-type N-terminal cleavage/methylation domain-containing protein